MAHEAEVARRAAVRRPLGPRVRYDDKCLEWDNYLILGESPTGAAQRVPAQWQLVYELRPLELIPYWLGIPFRPYHPVYAVIYDQDAPGFYTLPAVKVPELGRPQLVRGVIPFARLLDAAAVVDRGLRALTDVVSAYVGAYIRAAVRWLSPPVASVVGRQRARR